MLDGNTDGKVTCTVCPHWSWLQPGQPVESTQAVSFQKPTWSIQKVLVPLLLSVYRLVVDLDTHTDTYRCRTNQVETITWILIRLKSWSRLTAGVFLSLRPNTVQWVLGERLCRLRLLSPFRMFCAVCTHLKDGEQYKKSITVLLSKRASPGRRRRRCFLLESVLEYPVEVIQDESLVIL